MTTNRLATTSAAERPPAGAGATRDDAESLAGPRDLTSRAAANTLVQLVAPALRVVLGIVLVAVLSRRLGIDGLGEYALVFTYVALFNVVFNDWGLSTIVLREISRRPEDSAMPIEQSRHVHIA